MEILLAVKVKGKSIIVTIDEDNKVYANCIVRYDDSTEKTKTMDCTGILTKEQSAAVATITLAVRKDFEDRFINSSPSTDQVTRITGAAQPAKGIGLVQ